MIERTWENIRIFEFQSFRISTTPPLDEEAGCYTQLYMRKMCFTKEHILI